MNSKVNKELLMVKFLYFFELAILSCLFIYMTPFMSEWGVTATELAVINFVANILTLFSRPLFGYIADKYQKYKELLAILAFSCGIVYSLHLATPKRLKSVIYTLNEPYRFNISTDQNLMTLFSKDQNVTLCWPSLLSKCVINGCNVLSVNFSLGEENYSYAQYVPLLNNFSCEMIPQRFTCKNVITKCNSSLPFKVSFNNVGLTWSATFWTLGLAKTVAFIFYSPLLSLTDAVTFVTLGPNRANKYGFNRMFGTIGILVFSIIMAGILQFVNLMDTGTGWLSNMQRFSQFTPCFVMAIIMCIIIMIISLSLHLKKSIKTDNFLKSLNILFRDWDIGVFFLFSMLGGFLLQVFGEYFFLIAFQRYSPLPKYFPGLVTVVMTLSESAAFGLSSHLLNFKDYEIWVSLSFLAWALRWFSYIFVENFWFLLLTEILHGPSFGVMLACMMSHIGKLGTHSTQGRIQGLFSGIYFNIGGALGGLVGGLILDNYGMFGLFKFMAVLSLVCSLYYPLQIYIIRRYCKVTKPTSEIIMISDHDSVDNGKLLSGDVVSSS